MQCNDCLNYCIVGIVFQLNPRFSHSLLSATNCSTDNSSPRQVNGKFIEQSTLSAAARSVLKPTIMLFTNVLRLIANAVLTVLRKSALFGISYLLRLMSIRTTALSTLGMG